MKKYPFKFLDAYSREDIKIFCGRKDEIAALYEMVFQSPVLLVYGASGTGKTSLIQCGLASKFETHDWLALPIRRGNNINTSFEKALADAGGAVIEEEGMDWLNEVMNDKETATVTKQLTPLARSFKAVYLNSFRPIYLIFDQFEELFILGTRDEQLEFIERIKEVLQLEQPVKMIFSIREEYLGHLYDFERAVPQLLRKKLRVEPMGIDKVKEVITGATSVEDSNVRLKEDEKDLIAESIFDKIKGKEKTLTIQLPYLQVFLDKLYLEITKDENRLQDAVFTMADLEKMKDLGDVLRNFLEDQAILISKKLSETYPGTTVEKVWGILSPFATLEGTKEPISKENLYERLAGTDKNILNASIDLFINRRILRYTDEPDTYEIAHDSLAKSIAAKRSDEEIALLEVKRLIKNQAALKAGARELFSEKQLNFIEPFIEKIKLVSEEKLLIAESYTAVANHKDAERKKEQDEKQRILDRQQLLEKSRRNQRWFLAAISVALILMIALFVYSLFQQRKAKIALEENIKQQALYKARELKSFGDSYKDLGKDSFACASFRAGLDSLKNYQQEEFYKQLKKLVDSCR